MSDMKKNILKKGGLVTLGLVGTLLFNPITVKASNYLADNKPDTNNSQYGVSIAADFHSMSYAAEIFKEVEVKWLKGSEVADFGYTKEFTTAPFGRYFNSKKSSKYNAEVPTTLPENVGTLSSPLEGKVGDWKIFNRGRDGNTAKQSVYFLFPRSARQADEVDKKEAGRVEKYLVKDLNKAISWVIAQTNWNETDLETKQKDFFYITGSLANIKETGEFEFKGHKFVAKWENQSNKSGRLTLVDSNTNEELKNLYYQINVYKDVDDEMEYNSRSNVLNDGNLAKLNWNQVIYYGNAAYVSKGLTSMNQDYQLSQSEDGLFEKLLASMFRGLYDALDGLLGTERFEKLMLGEGEMYTWYGVAPVEWFNISGALFWVFQVLAWIILPGAVVKLFTSNLVDSSNTFARVQLMEGARDILIAAFLLTLISPIFELLAKFNYLFVDIIANLTNSNVAILEGDGLVGEIAGHGGLAGAILLLVYFGLNVYFNAIFILRAVAVCLLYGLSPAFTMLYAFGGKYKSLTLRFYKEVVGNIFIGSFYAVIVTFYAMFYNNGSGSTKGLLISFVLMWAFIPMTKLFKSLTGIGESDFISQTAATAQSKVQGAIKDYGVNPAKRFGKGAVEGGYKGFKSYNNIRKEHKKLQSDKAKNDEKGIESQISGYEGGGLSKLAGAATYAVGSAINSKMLKEIGMDKINNSGNAGELEEMKHGGPKYREEEKGKGYSGTDVNEKGNYEHSFNKKILQEESGVIDTRMSGDGKNVEQTYSADYIKKHPEFFNKVAEGTKDGKVSKELYNEGIRGSRIDENGNMTISYSAQKLDVEGVRNDGANIIVERGSSVTKPTADLSDQIGDLSNIVSTLEGSTTRNESASTKIERDARELVDGMNDEKK